MSHSPKPKDESFESGSPHQCGQQNEFNVFTLWMSGFWVLAILIEDGGELRCCGPICACPFCGAELSDVDGEPTAGPAREPATGISGLEKTVEVPS